jgi:hypothetical protein
MEFLTHQTTSPSEMLEKTTCEIFYQKGPPVGGGTPGPGGTCPCRRSHRRHVAMWQHAATPIGGRAHLVFSMPPPHAHAATLIRHLMHMPPLSLAAGPTGRMASDMPAMATAAGVCRHWPRRHVPRVAWPGGAATRRGFDKKFRRWSFLAFHSRRWSHMSKIRVSSRSSTKDRAVR